jgi:hypothetical protein
MSKPSRLLPRAWILFPVLALGLVAWSDYLRLQRVEFVSNVAREDAAVDARSPSGYAGGKRWLIVPEHNNPTYQWIEETQLMLARGDWRVRSVDYENAPFGRDVHAASPYRWWMAAIAWVDHAATGRPVALCVERSALVADPLLHLIFLAGAAVFVARRFGAFASALLSAGIAALYPLAASFLPGVANDFGLEQISLFWALLLLVAGSAADTGAPRWFFLAGIAGGCSLWLDAAGATPLLVGVAAGGVLAALLCRGKASAAAPPPWRAWGFGGAITSLLAYLVEYFPSHMEPQLRVNYPLYGVAWIGLAEILWRIASWSRGAKPVKGASDILAWVAAVAAVASLPVALRLAGGQAFLAGNLLDSRLTNLPDGVVAAGLRAWASRDGLSGPLAATLVPLVLVIPAAWILAKGKAPAGQRAAVAVALGPVGAALILACGQLRWWNTVDCALLALAVACVCGPAAKRWAWSAAATGVLVLGLVQLAPNAAGGTSEFRFTRAEVEGLYERALAQWIADRAGPDGATILTPPLRTSSFCFYGGLRGLGTPNWENRDGLSATFRIVTSTRPDETLALINQRGVTHIVVPSWDNDLDDFARMGLKQPQDSFIVALHRTDGGIFNWLRPMPYSQPAITGFNEQSVLVLEVTDETDPATLRGRLVEYLIEMHQIDQASFSSQGLLRYPADLGALVALAQVEKAKGNDEGFQKVFASLASNMASGSDRSLAWDRRVSLAVVLALGGREDLSRVQAERCLKSMNPERLRSLTTGSLYHLLVLFRHFGLEVTDPELRALSLKLLPSELRERL